MKVSNSNTCSTLYNREIFKNPFSYNKLISDRLSRKTDLLYKRDLIAHYGCVNAIEFSNNGRYLVSGGDDRRVLLWNVQKALHNCGKPTVMLSEHHSNIFCLSFDNSITHIYSAGNDDQVILHDMETGKACDVFNLENPVYRISVDPCNDNIFASAGEDGRILIFDTRLNPNSDPYQLASFKSAFHAVMFNPVDPRLITTANSKEGAALWDIRVSDKVLLQYGRKGSCMNVRWDQTGTRILALRRRQTPILYEFNQPKHIAQFFHENYFNSCTMKSCCFAGLKDEFVLSGSDDFNLYMWKISDALKNENRTNNVHLVLKGHRSIVNQVRFDPYNCVIASSGVEKLIKIWSPMALPHGTRDSTNWIRRRYTHDEYISLLLRSGQFMSHDYSEQSTSEDPQMMAFFDSLVQRERECNASDSDDSSGASLCTGIDCFEETDYSSLSEELNVPSSHTVVHTISLDVNNESSSSNSQVVVHSEEENTATVEVDDSNSLRRRSRSLPRRPLGLYYTTVENNEQTALSSTSSSSFSSSSSSTSSSSYSSFTAISFASSSTSEEEKDARFLRKRKSKSNVKEALQRLKRVRSAAFESPASPPLSTPDSAVSDQYCGSNSGLEICASNGGTSTDTLDSGVYLYPSPPRPKYKFTSFKKNQKKMYRTRKTSRSSLSSSSDSD